jgi:cytochrome d ubiquinol oxidase subunit I
MARFLLVLKPRSAVQPRALIEALKPMLQVLQAEVDHETIAHLSAVVRVRGEQQRMQLFADVQNKADGVVPGLNDFVTPEGDVLHPPVAPVFYGFRVMVGIGMLMLLVSWTVAFTMLRRKPGSKERRGVEGLPRWMLYGLVAMSFSGWVATLAGWYVTEIGRQPWLVDGVLTTRMAVADVPAPMVLSTLIGYLAVYGLLIVAYLGAIFYLARKASKGGTGPVVPGARLEGMGVAAE